jgi:hypothetical protein
MKHVLLVTCFKNKNKIKYERGPPDVKGMYNRCVTGIFLAFSNTKFGNSLGCVCDCDFVDKKMRF